MPRELIGKRYEGTADLNQTVPGVNIGDEGQLQVRSVEQLVKLHPVGASLILHDDEITVCKHGAAYDFAADRPHFA